MRLLAQLCEQFPELLIEFVSELLDIPPIAVFAYDAPDGGRARGELRGSTLPALTDLDLTANELASWPVTLGSLTALLLSAGGKLPSRASAERPPL